MGISASNPNNGIASEDKFSYQNNVLTMTNINIVKSMYIPPTLAIMMNVLKQRFMNS